MKEVKAQREDIGNISTVIGDIIFARGTRLLLKGNNDLNTSYEAVDIILDAAEKAGGAQFEELAGWCEASDHTETLNRILQDKAGLTAFVAPLIGGCRLAYKEMSISSEKILNLESACKEWGLAAGAAFQGLSSMASIILESDKTGKDNLEDLFSGRQVFC